MLIWLYLLHVQPRLPVLSPPCLSARWMESPVSQRWQNATQTCQTYCDSAPLQILVRIKKARKKNIRIKNYSKQFCFNSLLSYCVALFQSSHFQETFQWLSLRCPLTHYFLALSHPAQQGEQLTAITYAQTHCILTLSETIKFSLGFGVVGNSSCPTFMKK